MSTLDNYGDALFPMTRPKSPHAEASAHLAKTLAADPVRVSILQEGIALTAGERNKEYGDPAINLGCAGRMKAVFRECLTREITPAEQEALDMVMTKLSRLATGAPKRDTYVDLATYAAIAGEVALTLIEAKPSIKTPETKLEPYMSVETAQQIVASSAPMSEEVFDRAKEVLRTSQRPQKA